ncbi:hypothetical protein CSC02_3349 [Enterobacter hormaechei subsp. hoffmannii]|nr:hypothetical protein CSC02_3349 [Enterobacter hormaechei subsp. hoffmannii]
MTLCAGKVKQMPAFANPNSEYSVKMRGLGLIYASCQQ